MSHKALIGAALVAVAVIGFAWVGMDKQIVQSMPAVIVSTSTPISPVTTKKSGGTTTVGTIKPAGSYTMADVAIHNTSSSCWAAINGNIYNLTSWISQHPGSQAPILSLCGTDGSAAFNGQHGGQRRPASELTNFYIGTLSQ